MKLRRPNLHGDGSGLIIFDAEQLWEKRRQQHAQKGKRNHHDVEGQTVALSVGKFFDICVNAYSDDHMASAKTPEGRKERCGFFTAKESHFCRMDILMMRGTMTRPMMVCAIRPVGMLISGIFVHNTVRIRGVKKSARKVETEVKETERA